MTTKNNTKPWRISKSVKKHAQILCLLSKLKPKIVRLLIQNADTDLIKTITSCSHDILNGRYSLSPHQRKRLSKYRYALRRLIERKTPLNEKRALLMKGGSMLPILISTIAPFLIKTFLPKLFQSISRKHTGKNK